MVLRFKLQRVLALILSMNRMVIIFVVHCWNCPDYQYFVSALQKTQITELFISLVDF